MMSSRKNLIFLWCLISTLILIGRPSLSETTIAEQTLTSDIIIEKMFQPGSGLPVGKILSVRGEALIFHRDPAVGYRAQTGLPLYAGDIIRTRGTSWISCRLIDGSNIALTAGATLTILQSNYNSARQSSVSFLKLNHGGARFKFNPSPDLSSPEFKIQTETAFIVTRNADFIIRLNPAETEIIALENSRLEVTGMAQPEEYISLTDFQRTTIKEGMPSQTVETLFMEDIEAMTAKFHLLPHNKLFAAIAEYNREDEITEETLVEDSVDREEPNSTE